MPESEAWSGKMLQTVMRHSLKYLLSLSERIRNVARFLVLKKKGKKKKSERKKKKKKKKKEEAIRL